MERSAGIGALLRRMEGLLAPLEAGGDPGRYFLATYLRTTRAVAEELERGGFRDPEWVERLAAQRVADLMAPGQVVLKLAVSGFGVRLRGA